MRDGTVTILRKCHVNVATERLDRARIKMMPDRREDGEMCCAA
jgi:hypothetical protein